MENKRSMGVTIFGWAFIVVSGLSLAKLITGFMHPLSREWLIALPVDTLLRVSMIILTFLSGIGILRLLPWARKLAIWITLISLTYLIISLGPLYLNAQEYLKQIEGKLSLPSGQQISVEYFRRVVVLVGTAFFAFYSYIIYFFTRPHIKEQFKGSNRA